MKTIKVILPAGEIPAGSRVTKVNGTKEHVLREEIQIYASDELKDHRRTLKSDDVRFCVDDEGGITAISASREMIWIADAEALMFHLSDEGD